MIAYSINSRNLQCLVCNRVVFVVLFYRVPYCCSLRVRGLKRASTSSIHLEITSIEINQKARTRIHAVRHRHRWRMGVAGAAAGVLFGSPPIRRDEGGAGGGGGGECEIVCTDDRASVVGRGVSEANEARWWWDTQRNRSLSEFGWERLHI